MTETTTSELAEKIAKDLDLLVKATVSREIDEYREYRNKFERLKFWIEDIHKEAETLYGDMKEDGLTANSIEAEGYLRCAKTILNELKHIDS